MFRPGASRNLVLLPCSECEEDNMQVNIMFSYNYDDWKCCLVNWF